MVCGENEKAGRVSRNRELIKKRGKAKGKVIRKVVTKKTGKNRESYKAPKKP
jgi:hypothetical protein